MPRTRLRRFGSRVRSIAAAALCLAAAHPVAGELLPDDRRTSWNPGIPGGVPARARTCATIGAASDGRGASDVAREVQTAIDACPPGQVVLLAAGTFVVDGEPLSIRKAVTLRGAGPGRTLVVRTNGAKEGSYTPRVAAPVIVVGPNRWPKPDNGTSRDLSADGPKGAHSVTVSDAQGFAAGQFVVLDEDHYATGSWRELPDRNGRPNPSKIWGTDRIVWQRHLPPSAGDDPFPAAAGWFSRPGRPLGEVKEIASVKGNTITFTTPLHIGYLVSRRAQVTRYADAHVKLAGVEDLTISGGSDGALRFESAAYSWARNIEDTNWLGEGIAINNSFRIEVRDSYVHHTVWPNPGGGGYALSLGNASSEVLIENNIIVDANKVMVARSAGAGSVVGYNYVDDGHIGLNPKWVEVGINASHMAGSHHMLFEGNYAWNYDADNTHGGSIYHTVFRNHLSGFRRSFDGLVNGRAAGLMYGSWWHSFVGNVLGTAGRMGGWIFEDSGTPWNPLPAVWRLGYDPIHWDQAPDPKVRATVLREGNYDFVTDQVHWDTHAQPIPDSLYLASKPPFFGALPWPWVDPVGTPKVHVLPAMTRYEAMRGVR